MLTPRPQLDLLDALDETHDAVERQLHALLHQTEELLEHLARVLRRLRLIRGERAHLDVVEQEGHEGLRDGGGLDVVVVANVHQGAGRHAANRAQTAVAEQELRALQDRVGAHVTEQDALRPEQLIVKGNGDQHGFTASLFVDRLGKKSALTVSLQRHGSRRRTADEIDSKLEVDGPERLL